MKKKVFISVLTVTSMMLSCGRITTFAAENDTDIAVAESITEANITPQMIIGVWEGTYDGGTDTGELVKRSIVFNVTECSEDGSFGGVADVTSTEGERYIFSGNCDFKTGAVTMQGNEWIIDYNQWNFLKFTGTYDTNFKSYYSPATRWEPAEEDMRRFYIGEDGVGLLDSVPKEIVDLIRIYKVVEDEDDAHYKESEPDEDAIYDAWKDRQLEED